MTERFPALNIRGRVAVISDVHAHLDALEAVIAEIDAEGIPEIWFLGDAVGYGPFPEEVAQLLKARASVALAGNHDHLVSGRLRFGELREHSGTALDSGRWTDEQLSEDTQAWLKTLEPHLRADAVELHHANPRTITSYVYESYAVGDAMWDNPNVRLMLLGHTHIVQAWKVGDPSTTDPDNEDYYLHPKIEAVEVGENTVIDLSESRWLLNPGSVGFPRLDDKRAHWLVLDFDQQTATFRRTFVDHTRTQAAIHAADGLPSKIASKLDEPLPSR